MDCVVTAVPMIEQIADFVNLFEAYRRAARGKRYRAECAAFEYNLEGHLLQLRDQLRAGTYRPGPYRRFTIADPKPRVISAAPFRDRVVHHALCAIIEPRFERRFIANSFASRPGKGIHRALDRCTYYVRRHRYVLKCDIVRFFPSIDLDILRHRILGRVIQDGAVLRLIQAILANGSQELIDQYDLVCFPGDDPAQAALRPRGLPIGNQTSQFLANCYLNPLDHYVTDQLGCGAYLRYVDDFLLFGDEKAQLHAWKHAIIDYLGTQLRQTIHVPEAVVIPVATGIPFLGFRVYPDHRRLRRRNGLAFAKRYRELMAAFRAQRCGVRPLAALVKSWIAHAKHGDTWGLRHAIFTKVATSTTAKEVAHG